MSRSYDESMARLAAIGRRPYIVNEKDPSRGYDRRWRIFVPAGSDGRPAERHDTSDDCDERDRQLAQIADRLAPPTPTGKDGE